LYMHQCAILYVERKTRAQKPDYFALDLHVYDYRDAEILFADACARLGSYDKRIRLNIRLDLHHVH
jgi:hypothetical protein